jgi:hypothetical protein
MVVLDHADVWTHSPGFHASNEGKTLSEFINFSLQQFSRSVGQENRLCRVIWVVDDAYKLKRYHKEQYEHMLANSHRVKVSTKSIKRRWKWNKDVPDEPAFEYVVKF